MQQYMHKKYAPIWNGRAQAVHFAAYDYRLEPNELSHVMLASGQAQKNVA